MSNTYRLLIRMKILIFLVLLGIHSTTAVTHSLKFFLTGSSQVPNFPEFVVVGMIDEVEVIHYDSDTKRAEPKQDWMNKIKENYPQHWERQTDLATAQQQVFEPSIEILKQRFNQTGGIHLVQLMCGCEWDDETGTTDGFNQYSYDGEDFVAFDLKTKTWIAPTPQAVITKHKWDRNTGYNEQWNNFLNQECPQGLKMYLNYGTKTLMRTDLPSVSLLQTSPSSPVSCHATGFYPDRATMFWRKDGEELHEDVDHGEMLPNHDGTFQMRVDLKLSSVKPEDWTRFDCVFQLSGADDIITKLDKHVIRTNEKSMTMIIICIVVGVLLVIIGLTGFFVYKKKKDQAKRSPSRK